jgi:hypothetical protein
VAEEEATGFEVGIVVPKLSRAAAAAQGGEDCLARLVQELEDVGLLVERVRGVPAEFIKVRVLPAPVTRFSNPVRRANSNSGGDSERKP